MRLLLLAPPRFRVHAMASAAPLFPQATAEPAAEAQEAPLMAIAAAATAPPPGQWEPVPRSASSGFRVRGPRLLPRQLNGGMYIKSRWSEGVSSGVLEWDVAIEGTGRPYAIGISKEDGMSPSAYLGIYGLFPVSGTFFLRPLGDSSNWHPYDGKPVAPEDPRTLRYSFHLDMNIGELMMTPAWDPDSRILVASGLVGEARGLKLCPTISTYAWTDVPAPYSVTISNVRATPRAFDPSSVLWSSTERDEHGRLPLHLACALPGHGDAVLAILRASPQMAREKDGWNQLPLHIACGQSQDARVVAALVEAYPDAAHITGPLDYLPLHVACDKKASLAIVQQLLATWPASVSERAASKKLPLHVAVTGGASAEVIEALLVALPDSVRDRDLVEGLLPLQWACRLAPLAGQLAVLLKAYPEVIFEKWDGGLPLHHALKSSASEGAVSVLLKADPSAARDADSSGSLPLHCAFGSGLYPSLGVVRLLLSAYPEAALEADGRGDLPLHLALSRFVDSGENVGVVSLLVAASPESVQRKGYDNLFPLHMLVKRGPPLSLVTAMLDAFPDAARKPDLKRRFPLHFAAGFMASESVVAALLSAHPAALRETDNDGAAPLHAACTNWAGLDVENVDLAGLAVVRLLAEADPSLLRQKTNNGLFPLHCAAWNKASLGVVSYLLEAAPEIVREATVSSASLPLHLACSVAAVGNAAAGAGANMAVVSLLLGTYPEAAAQKNRDGNFPLHHAIEGKCAAGVFTALLQAFPDAIKALDNEGRMPLVRAAEIGVSPSAFHVLLAAWPDGAREKHPVGGAVVLHNAVRMQPAFIVSAVVQAWPAGTREVDSAGNTALGVSVSSSVGSGTVRVLLGADPGAAERKSKSGSLPLHLACASAALPSTISELLAANPRTAQELNGARRLPLNLACEQSDKRGWDCAAVIRLLLDANPAAATAPDGSGKSPLHWLCEKNAPPQAILLLLRACPKAALEKDARSSKLPVQVGLSCDLLAMTPLLQSSVPVDSEGCVLAHGSFSGWTAVLGGTEDRYITAVEAVLDAHAAHVSVLANARDEHGRRAASLATPKCKAAIMRRLYLCGRYNIHEGPPEHASATSLVYFADDHLANGAQGRAETVVLKLMQFRDQFEREQTVRLREVVAAPAVVLSADAAAAAVAAAAADAEAASTDTSISAAARRRAADAASAGSPDDAFIVPVLRAHDSEADADFRQQLVARHLDTHPYMLVLAAGDRALAAVIDHERSVPTWKDEVRRATHDIAAALAHMHAQGVIHGDVKPRNVVRVGASYRLIDLDAAARFPGGTAGTKTSTAFAPPELLRALHRRRRHQARIATGGVASDAAAAAASGLSEEVEEDNEDEGEATAGVGGAAGATGGAAGAAPDAAATFESGVVPADPSFDIWSLGASLYQLITGHTLIHADASDNAVSPVDLRELSKWRDEDKSVKLAHITDPKARHLLSLLLYRDPAKRPMAARVLEHPFVTGRVTIRLENQEADWDVFLSYRVAADEALARDLHARLKAAGLRVWFDKAEGCIPLGREWRSAFCAGLCTSRAFVPIVSRAAMNALERDEPVPGQNWNALRDDSPCDNVLLEHRLALELKERRLLELICPVFVGDETRFAGNRKRAGPATPMHEGFDWAGAPSKSNAAVVASVEAELRAQLDDAGMGAPLIASPSVGAIWARISGFQSEFVEGPRADALAQVVDGVLAMFATLDGDGDGDGDGASEAGASSAQFTDSSPLPASASADRLRRRVAQLEGENAQLQGQVAMLLQVAAAARGGSGGAAAAPAPRSAAAPTPR